MVRAMETLVVALLCAVVALVGADTEPFPLSAELAWGLGTKQYESVRDRTQGWQKKDTTECYTGNELYSQSTVFCDRECLETTDKKDHWRCEGPWYCAKTEVGQEFWDDMDSHGANWKRANVAARRRTPLRRGPRFERISLNIERRATRRRRSQNIERRATRRRRSKNIERLA